MPAGIGIGQVFGLVREARGLEGAAPVLSVSGPGAADLADGLAAGGESRAIVVGGDPHAAAVAVRIVEGEPAEAELAVLRRIAREGTPLVVVRPAGSAPIPTVLPLDVVEAGALLSAPAVVDAIARAAGSTGPALAARLPVLRPAVSRRLISTTAWANALVAAASRSEAQRPLLTLAQARMTLLLGVSRGAVLPANPRQLAVAAAPAVAGAVAVGYVGRGLVRRLPSRGPLTRALVAYAGTRSLGVVSRRI
jgi:uncharacterized protein (DUF697 family)